VAHGQSRMRVLRSVLIANRGEIAVRIIRACADLGLRSIAVYSPEDIDALHVRMADEAYALPEGPPVGYLDSSALIGAARRSGADAVHPGYGFLSENAEFGRAVIEAGLIWVGPPPEAVQALGDKVSARAVATRVGAPLAAGSPGPVADAAEITRFANGHGLPVAIKAAFGGGGRGLKVAHALTEIPALFESAVREAVTGFGRGEVFVERYLGAPRHVETQCLADSHGKVVVISTRDCSLQRRHQKLVEEAPAPFLSSDQRRRIVSASKAILKEVGYVGAGTCEFLVDTDGAVSFLEVNTRLQVEHPVSEEVTGIDLVTEQLRLATGEPLGYDDPSPRGHAIEFRINAEDPGRDFLPAPGRITSWRVPGGPGVRVDAGYEGGQVVPAGYDSLLAKLIIIGRDRNHALARARRALAEFEVGGMPTVLPFHRAVVDDPAFAAPNGAKDFTVHTRWIETASTIVIPPYEYPAPSGRASGTAAEAAARTSVVVEVDGRRLSVSLPAGLGAGFTSGGAAGGSGSANGLAGNGVAGALTTGRRPRGRGRRGAGAGDRADSLTAPMQGTVVRVEVADGDLVAEGDTILVLEAMKMEQPITAHRSGRVRGLRATTGSTVAAGALLCTIDAVEAVEAVEGEVAPETPTAAAAGQPV
jgi:acetyl-CoA/propionyl-CoA carboxylase biotin carboxyl carrier protein